MKDNLEKKVICDMPCDIAETPLTLYKKYCGRTYSLGSLPSCDIIKYEVCLKRYKNERKKNGI